MATLDQGSKFPVIPASLRDSFTKRLFFAEHILATLRDRGALSFHPAASWLQEVPRTPSSGPSRGTFIQAGVVSAEGSYGVRLRLLKNCLFFQKDKSVLPSPNTNGSPPGLCLPTAKDHHVNSLNKALWKLIDINTVTAPPPTWQPHWPRPGPPGKPDSSSPIKGLDDLLADTPHPNIDRAATGSPPITDHSDPLRPTAKPPAAVKPGPSDPAQHLPKTSVGIPSQGVAPEHTPVDNGSIQLLRQELASLLAAAKDVEARLAAASSLPPDSECPSQAPGTNGSTAHLPDPVQATHLPLVPLVDPPPCSVLLSHPAAWEGAEGWGAESQASGDPNSETLCLAATPGGPSGHRAPRDPPLQPASGSQAEGSHSSSGRHPTPGRPTTSHSPPSRAQGIPEGTCEVGDGNGHG